VQTRKDLLQAHRLMTQRAALALVLGEPDNPELPLRRLNVAAFCGVMVALLVMAAFGIYGLLNPGGATGLQQAGMLIVEKETGARYVWCQNQQLCPVANYVSARLLAGADDGHRKSVSRNSLTAFDRGPEVGIPGAPNTLPDAKKLVRTPWSVCVRTVDNGVTGRTPVVTLVAGHGVGGQGLRDDQAVAAAAAGQTWLIWRNHRLRVPHYAVSTLSTLPPQVAAKWLNALPAGPDYQAPDIPGRGTAVTGPRGPAKVGQVFQVDAASGTAWYVLLRDGLAPISALEKELLRADPASSQAYGNQPFQAIPLDPASVSAYRASPTVISRPELAGRPPQMVQYADSTPLCAVYDDPTGNSAGHLALGGRLPAPPSSTAPTGVDQLVFPPGGGALVGLEPEPGKPSSVSTYFLVTEGHRYALKSADVATKLGYAITGDQTSNAFPMPASVLGLIPLGPVLDPGAAANPISGGQITPQPSP
jgi:type VII secretion protein EccB